jgi:AcrR family transcriptional regulator
VTFALATRVAQSAVVAAAVGVFARRGFSSTRVEDILAAAGIARRTFYKYFQSKDDVLAAIYDLATGELLRDIRSAASESEADPFASVLRGLDTYLDYHVENAPLLRVLVGEAIRADSPLAPARRRFRAELARILGEVAQAVARSDRRARSPNPRRGGDDPMLYLALISALEGVSLDLLAEPRPAAADVRCAKAVMRILLRRALIPADADS